MKVGCAQGAKKRAMTGSSAPDPRAGPSYDLYRRFRRILVERDAFDDVESLGLHVLRSLVEDSGPDSPVLGGCLYLVVDDELRLVAQEVEGGSTDLGACIPLDEAMAREILDRGFLVEMRPDPRDGSGSVQASRPDLAAIAIGGDPRAVVCLALRPGLVVEEVEPAIEALHSVSDSSWRGGLRTSELLQAAEVQTSLFADISPELPGYELVFRQRPADIVGGDFYDASELTLGTQALVIGDATGHGLAAALQARDAVIGMRMGIRQQLTAVAMFSRLDEVLAQASGSRRFVSACYIELDTQGNFIYVNAGHPPPVILDKEGGALRELKVTGPVLGLPTVARRRYSRAFGHLEPGEILLAYTDGLVEATDSRGVELGRGALVSRCQAEAGESLETLADTLFAVVDAHSGGVPQADDQTVLLLRRSR